MTMSSGNESGIGIIDIFGVVFVVLKLVGVIEWRWVWVLSPFWGGLILDLVLTAVVGLIEAWKS